MEQWIDLAKTFVNPISGDLPIGEDPRYSDVFSRLKAEVEKKSDVDFEKIRNLSESILKDSAKDLRVVSYLIMALARIEGLVGLAKGMAILYELVNQYGESLLPAKPKAQLSAIRWFQQDKVLTFAQASTKDVSLDDAEGVVSIHGLLFEKLSEFVGEPMSWPDLKKWLDEEKRKVEPVSNSGTSEVTNTELSSRPAPVSPPGASAVSGQSSIGSTAQYTQTIKSLLAYFREQSHYSKMFGVACSCQWGNLKLPPNENGKTRLSAPRDTSLNRIRNALDNEQWQEGLLACLDAFMEPGGQFLLEIVKNAYDCARHAGEKETALIIESQVKALVTRLPKLQQLKFDNDDPFVSSVVSSWIEQMTESSGNQLIEGDGANVAVLLQQAREVLNSDGVGAAFELLDNRPIKSRMQGVQIEYCKAQLCIEQDRSDIALPILLQLEKDVEQLQLVNVAPDFAMQIWRGLYRLQKDRLANIEQEGSRLDTENHIARLQSLMCTTDVASAMQWL
jgi:type VI secretion system protein VasJ